MNKPVKTQATIINIIDYPGDIKHFELKLDDEINFKAGQFINLSFEKDGTTYRRPYSIATPPSQKSIGLCVKLVPEGHLTPVLWSLQKGDRVNIMGALGLFTMEEVDKEKVVFIGVGTGIGPLRSMIFDQLENQSQKEFRLIYGVRYNGEHTYGKEFEMLEEIHPNFKYIPVVSRPDSEWEGRQGYVQQNLDGIDTQETKAYVCGLPEMVDAVKEELFLKGMSEEDIIVEKY